MTYGPRIIPAAQAGWGAVEAVFASEASARNCWCQFHLLSNAEAAATDRESRRAMLQDQVARLDPPRGLLALDGVEAVGWCGVEPRERLRHVLASRLVIKNSPYRAEDAGVWAVYCILVPPRRRRTGLGAALLHAAVEHALRGGATALEGYPIDTDERGGILPPGFSTGALSMFVAEGFASIAALPSGRTLVHRRVGGDHPPPPAPARGP